MNFSTHILIFLYLDCLVMVKIGGLTLRIFKLIQAGSIPPLLLMCSHEQLLDGKYLHG